MGEFRQRISAGVQTGEVDAAVGQAGEDLRAVVCFGVGCENGVASVKTCVGGVGVVE